MQSVSKSIRKLFMTIDAGCVPYANNDIASCLIAVKYGKQIVFNLYS